MRTIKLWRVVQRKADGGWLITKRAVHANKYTHEEAVKYFITPPRGTVPVAAKSFDLGRVKLVEEVTTIDID